MRDERGETGPQWERYNSNEKNLELVERLKVPGGWLYRTMIHVDENAGARIAISVVFVPDPIEAIGIV